MLFLVLVGCTYWVVSEGVIFSFRMGLWRLGMLQVWVVDCIHDVVKDLFRSVQLFLLVFENML